VVTDDCGGLGGECWDLRVLLLDNGDFEAFEFFTDNVPGRVPKAVLGNFDGDDVPDFAAAVVPFDAMADQSQVAVLYNFPEPMASSDVDVAVFAHSLEAADLDGNGLDDLLIGAEVSNTLVFVPSTGNGFGTERVIITDPTPRLAPPVDMDGDGDLDLIVASEVQATVGVDLNDGDAQFTPQTRQELGPGLAITALASADFDADGNGDVVVVAVSADGVTGPVVAVFRGLGNGLLEPLVTHPGGELPVDVLAEDINLDGEPDIIVADLLEDKLPVFINRGGNFPDQIGIDVAAAPVTMLRGDFDRDSFADLVIGNANGVISVVRSEN
jgi:hypothetical protein